MYCRKCGKEIQETSVYCQNCGYKLKNDIEDVRSIKTEAYNKSLYNKSARVVSVLWGSFGLLASIGSGIPYYINSGLPLVIITEILLMPLGISLILLGLFPEYINNKVQIKEKYPEIIVGIIILSIIIYAIQPQPPETLWDYGTNF